MTMPVFVDGTLVHATALTSLSTGVNSLNTLLTGAVAPRAYVPTATARITSNKTISNNTDTVVTFDAAGVNNDGAWTSSVNHFTIKTAGVYFAWAQTHFTAAASGIRACHIMLNGTSISSNSVAAASRNALNFGDGNFFACITPPLSLAVNATLYFAVYQNSGGSLTLDASVSGASMSLARIGS